MKKVRLGNTGAEVSAMCFGTGFGCVDDSTRSKILDVFIDAGGTFIDTAELYGRSEGDEERFLGKWMSKNNKRSQVFIATKVSPGCRNIPVDKPFLTADSIQSACEGSLKRMGIETIDLYYAHGDDRRAPLEETLRAFDKLVKDGKVRFIGASNYTLWRLEKARNISESNNLSIYSCLENRYTYFQPRVGLKLPKGQVTVTDETLEYCREYDIPIVAYGALMRGAYASGDLNFREDYLRHYHSRDNEDRLKALTEVAQKKNRSVTQIVLAWMLAQRAPLVIPLFQASSVEHLQEDIGALEITLDDEDMQILNH